MSKYYLNYLDELESEAIFVLREIAAQFKNPMILFSGGKDSIVVTHLAKKAFYPSRIPFKLLHIDTGHNFPETIIFRDQIAEDLKIELVIGSVQESINNGRVAEEKGKSASRNTLQITTLLDTIEKEKIDCAIGGGRRDEEKSRAKERFFSHRDEFGQWDPKNQRPELWDIYNTRTHPGENIRVFPISNWTELDVWEYIAREKLEVPKIYFAHTREVIRREAGLLPVSHLAQPQSGEEIEHITVRFRTVGDMSCTCPVESDAADVDEIIAETAMTRITEPCHTRMGGPTSDAS